jgi:hypothetical protein
VHAILELLFISGTVRDAGHFWPMFQSRHLVDITSNEEIQAGHKRERRWSLVLVLQEHLVCVIVEGVKNVDAYRHRALCCVPKR